jgi:hypothetical protein
VKNKTATHFATGLCLLLGSLHGLACSSGDAGGGRDAATDRDMADAAVDSAVPRPVVVDTLEDLGLLPLPSEVTAGRDGGNAGLLGGKLLWLFGDTFLTAKNPIDDSNVLSATAGWSTVDEPLVLTQPVDDGGFPNQTIPYTAGELAQNLDDPLNGWALWPGTMLDTGEAEGLIFFQRIKRTDGSGFDSQGVGTARIAVDGLVATRNEDDLFTPPEPIYMPHVIFDGYAYAYACESVGFLNVGCTMARAPAADADTRSAFEFYDGEAWQDDITKAEVVIDEVSGPPSLSYNPFLHQYLAVTHNVLSSDIQLRTATEIVGPWSDAVIIEPDGEEYLPPLDENAFNYIVVEHPELRSADGKSIVISYSRPTEAFRGDVRLLRVTLK